MGARGSVSITRGGKPKKKSRFSPAEQVERARVGSGIKRRKGTTVSPYGRQFDRTRAGGRYDRLTQSGRGRKEVAQVRAHHARRAGGGSPRARREKNEQRDFYSMLRRNK